MSYGRALRLARAARDMSQKDLAERSGISCSQISLIEAGKRMPSVDLIERIASAVQLKTWHLMVLAGDGKLDDRTGYQVLLELLA